MEGKGNVDISNLNIIMQLCIYYVYYNTTNLSETNKFISSMYICIFLKLSVYEIEKHRQDRQDRQDRILVDRILEN